MGMLRSNESTQSEPGHAKEKYASLSVERDYKYSFILHVQLVPSHRLSQQSQEHPRHLRGDDAVSREQLSSDIVAARSPIGVVQLRAHGGFLSRLVSCVGVAVSHALRSPARPGWSCPWPLSERRCGSGAELRVLRPVVPRRLRRRPSRHPGRARLRPAPPGQSHPPPLP